MRIYWKSLLGFGFVFWSVLCLNDLLGGMPKYHANELVLEAQTDYRTVKEDIYENIEGMTKLIRDSAFKQRVFKFGWTLLVWNSATFVFSLAFCFCAKTLSWIAWKIFVPGRTGHQLISIHTFPHLANRSNSNLSKIPVKVRTFGNRSSDTNLNIKPKINPDCSCPNLLENKGIKNTAAHSQVFYDTTETVAISPQCKTIYKNDKMFQCDDENEKRFDRHLEQQCTKLREEMAKLQANSLKEHAVLSRKLESVNKEKKELTKQVTVVQKENRAAKQQMEELLLEKATLVKRLENATKEFKANTKTKKIALQKLEEVTANHDKLKEQLEQVTRDKEILESKLKLLETEYEKLQERVIMSTNINLDSYNQNPTPERDGSGTKIKGLTQKMGETELYQTKSDTHLASVSQTEMDMKKIQVKIQQLERNLENFNRNDINFRSAEGESETSISHCNATDSGRTNEDTDISDNSPRFGYWSGRAGDMIQSLAHRMNEKVGLLGYIRECKSEKLPENDRLNAYSRASIRPPERIVSSSAAFKKFLKGLHDDSSMYAITSDSC